jgi:hypothetical protein
MPVALDHAAQAQALVERGEIVGVFHAGVGEVQGDAFADPGAGVGGGTVLVPGGEDVQLGQQVAVSHVLNSERAAGERLGHVHCAQGAADSMVVQVPRDGGEVFPRNQQRGGEAAQRTLGRGPPPLLPLGKVDELAGKGHQFFRETRGRRDGGTVFNARRRQQRLACLERH